MLLVLVFSCHLKYKKQRKTWAISNKKTKSQKEKTMFSSIYLYILFTYTSSVICCCDVLVRNIIKSGILTIVHVCVFSSCESRNLWGNCCTPMLQQEQDRREIPDCQMLLLPWTGGGNNKSGSILCRRYARFLIIVLVMIWDWLLIRVEMWYSAKLSHLSLCLWCSFHWLFGYERLIVWKEKKKRVEIFMIVLFGLKRFIICKIKSPTCSFVHPFVYCWGYIRPCVEQSRQKVRSFNIISKVASVTGESIPVSSFHCNGSDMGLLDFDSFLFTLEMSGEAVSPL